jgi:hypothetical protein
MAISANEARAIAKEAYIYGFPLVDSYRIQYSYFVDQGEPEYKAPWNQIENNARVYTPADKAIQTPNSDTPYSFVGADLRGEPLLLTLPVVESDRYFSVQFIDAYTFNFAYLGSRTSGNGGGNFLLAGPKWKGEKPPGVKDVIRSETEFALLMYRMQLFNPDDLDNVKKVQAGYGVQSLSQFLGKSAPSAAPKVDFLKPLSATEERTCYFQSNPLNAYTLNNITAKKNADGSITVQFGGCDGKSPNCLPTTKGWNYLVRLYRPRPDILNGTWKFPDAQPMS